MHRVSGASDGDRDLSIVELLRHAGAEPRDEWAEPDHRRPLDDTGREQAAALVDSLRPGPPITDILSSPAVRCRQTVEPLARALGLEIRCDERLDEVEAPVADEGEEWVSAAWKGGRALRLLDELTSGTVDGRVVCCSHGDVIPATVALIFISQRDKVQRGS